MLVFGRAARAESFARGFLHDSWRIEREGRLIWVDALRLEGDVAAKLRAPLAFAGAGALATALYVGADTPAHLPLARELTESGRSRGAATIVNGVLIARFLGPRADLVRGDLARYIAALRAAAGGLPNHPPRIWNI
jgi:urease accessory protein